ncbi:MAG: hypothetical protein AB1798_19410, partial [Spirochaetota bacterium]
GMVCYMPTRYSKCAHWCGAKVYFTTGPTPNFGLVKPGPGQANFVFRGDEVLLEAWRNWFNLAWNESNRLAEKVSRIYEKGMQVNFDKFSRIQPLDAPIRA